MLIERRRNLVQTRIQRIHENQSLLREQSREQLPERAPVRLLSFVTFCQVLREPFAAVFLQ